MPRTVSQPDLLPGLLIGNKYEIVRPLGQGGMGVVYEARHRELGRSVAIKFLTIDDESLAKRFAREARLAAQLRSEQVVSVIDYSPGDGTSKPYLVLELLVGEDLRTRVRRGGPLTVEAAVGYLLQAMLGIAEAHSLDIIHRDIKPANLFLARSPNGAVGVKVMDFGVSKSRSATIIDAELTGVAALLGTIAYAAPEILVEARSADARADIWSIGVTLYHLVTARLPFEANTPAATITHILQKPPTPPQTYRPDLPPAFVDVILRCLERDPGHRHGNVAELAAALVPFGPAGSDRVSAQVARVLDVPVLSARSLAPPDATGSPRDTVKMDQPISESLLATVRMPSQLSRHEIDAIDESITPMEVAQSDDFPTAPLPNDAPPESRRNLYLAIAAGCLMGLVCAALYAACAN